MSRMQRDRGSNLAVHDTIRTLVTAAAVCYIGNSLREQPTFARILARLLRVRSLMLPAGVIIGIAN